MSSILDRFGKSWKAAARDVVLIVAGIVIAFSLEASWQEREENQRLKGNLEALKAEFESILLITEDDSSYVTSSLDAVREILGVMGPEAQASSLDSISLLLNHAMKTRTLDLPSGALGSMLVANEISLIRSDSLRTLLSDWASLVEDVGEQMVWMRRDLDGKIKPLVSQYVPLRDILVRPSEQVRDSRFMSDQTALLRDRSFEALLADRLQVGGTAEVEFGNLRRAALRAIGLIEAEVR